MAEAIRDLIWHEQQAHLTKADLDLLDWGRELLTAEIAAITNGEFSSAKQKIRAALRKIRDRNSWHVALL